MSNILFFSQWEVVVLPAREVLWQTQVLILHQCLKTMRYCLRFLEDKYQNILPQSAESKHNSMNSNYLEIQLRKASKILD